MTVYGDHTLRYPVLIFPDSDAINDQTRWLCAQVLEARRERDEALEWIDLYGESL